MNGERQMFAVHTKRTWRGWVVGVPWFRGSLRSHLNGLPLVRCEAPSAYGERPVEIPLAEGDEDVVEGVLDGPAGGVDPDGGVLAAPRTARRCR